MNDLRESLACLDNPDRQAEIRVGSRSVEYDEVNHYYNCLDDNGNQQQASLSEMITDLEWGIEYDFDQVNAPRNEVKKYLIERAKSQLRDLLNTQIVKSESTRGQDGWICGREDD